MTKRPIFESLCQKLRQFGLAHAGNIAVTFALTLVPIMGTIGGAVDYSRANSVKSSMQGALDAAALATIKLASTLTSAQIQTKAQGYFTASFNRPEASGIQVTSQYNAETNTLTLNGSATVSADFVKVIGISQLNVSASSKAMIGSKTWQVCVIVTNPDSNHTLLAKSNGKIDFTNCMVQVNTQNWDAVESRDTSYIHSINGENCFVGDIHYGDVVPPKNPTCTFFPDPFSTYTVPTNTCTYTNKAVTSAGTTLSPGTYCGGINISADVTFSPGVYYIQNGDFKVTGSANVTANNVTFLISGQNSNLDIQTTGTLTLSPNTDSAGQWAGFVFYYDLPSSKNNSNGKSTIAKATVNMSGVIYLVGQQFHITSGAVVNVNPGSILADFILPDGGTLNLTGSLNSSLAVLNSLKKTGTASVSPVLVQ
jgi:Flp pilus assembly protein TadG